MQTDREALLAERVPGLLELIKEHWPANAETFGWRMIARRLEYNFESFCHVRSGHRSPPKTVLLGMLQLADEVGQASTALKMLTEGTRSNEYSQSQRSSGPVPLSDWASRRQRTALRS